MPPVRQVTMHFRAVKEGKYITKVLEQECDAEMTGLRMTVLHKIIKFNKNNVVDIEIYIYIHMYCIYII